MTQNISYIIEELQKINKRINDIKFHPNRNIVLDEINLRYIQNIQDSTLLYIHKLQNQQIELDEMVIHNLNKTVSDYHISIDNFYNLL